MSGKQRRYTRVDWLACQLIGNHADPRTAGNCRSLWMAMETLAWEQRKKHHGRAFVTNQPHLAKVACISVPSVKRLGAFFEELGVLTITRRRTSARRYDLNHYALKYPQAIAHGELWYEESHSSCRGGEHDLVLHSKGGAELPPAAAAASPLALRGNSAPLYKDNPESVALLAVRLQRLAGVSRKTNKCIPAKNPEALRALRDSLDREGRRCLFKAFLRLDEQNDRQSDIIYREFKPSDADEDIYAQALYVTYSLKYEGDCHEAWTRVYGENRAEIIEWLDSLTGKLGERWHQFMAEELAAADVC